MIRLLYIFLLTVLVTHLSYGQNKETLKGIFEYHEILNEYRTFDKKQKESYLNTLQKLNIGTINSYFELIEKANQYAIGKIDNLDSLFAIQRTYYEKADSVINTDSLLKGVSARMISLLYSMSVVNKYGFLKYPCISLKRLHPNGTVNIYMTEEQLNEIKAELGKEIELNVVFVGEAKWTKFKIYSLIDE